MTNGWTDRQIDRTNFIASTGDAGGKSCHLSLTCILLYLEQQSVTFNQVLYSPVDIEQVKYLLLINLLEIRDHSLFYGQM